MPDQTQGQAVLPGHPCLTPNLQRFADQGVVFRNAFCPSPHCCPSRASFQTGLYPSEHGVFNNVDTDTAIHTNPYPGTKFFAEYLRKAGYELDYSGKWHVARDIGPWEAGWANSYTSYPAKWRNEYNYVPGKERQDRAWLGARNELTDPELGQRGRIFRPGWGNIELFKTLPTPDSNPLKAVESQYQPVHNGAEKLRRLAGTGKPWALMISNDGSHDLYDVPQHFVDMYDLKAVELPASFRDTLEDKPRIYQRMRYQYWCQLSDEEVRNSILHYWAKTTMQDALFGFLLDALEQTGQADNTLVVYISDHGDYAGAHGLWAKGVPSFREGYNIPAVIRWPQRITNPGRQVDAFVSTTDFAPTILEAAGIAPADYQVSGKSLLPLLQGATPEDWRDAIFCQLNGVELYYTQRIVMTKDYKYVYNGFDYDELYDLQSDPNEMVNLAFPDVKKSQAMVELGTGYGYGNNAAWPPLPEKLAEVRRDLIQRMWKFAQEHKDQIFDPYITVAMAPLGPGVAL